MVNKTDGEGNYIADQAELAAHDTDEIHRLITGSAGAALLEAALRYRDDDMPGGEIGFTLLAYSPILGENGNVTGYDDPIDFTVTVDIIGRGKGRFPARALAGRRYDRFFVLEPPTPTIGGNDAVSIQTVLTYTPQLAKGDFDKYPILSARNSGTEQAGTSFFERMTFILLAGICPCRASRAALGDSCADNVDDWRVQVGDIADCTVETGRAHYITKERAPELLHRPGGEGQARGLRQVRGVLPRPRAGPGLPEAGPGWQIPGVPGHDQDRKPLPGGVRPYLQQTL